MKHLRRSLKVKHPFGRFCITEFSLSRKLCHTVIVRDVKQKKVIEISPARFQTLGNFQQL